MDVINTVRQGRSTVVKGLSAKPLNKDKQLQFLKLNVKVNDNG